MNAGISVTGIGVCSAIGNDLESFAQHLRTGVSGVREYRGVVPGSLWAGLVADSPHVDFDDPDIDRSAQLAIRAALGAAESAFGDQRPPGERIGLVMGTSHGGRSQLDFCAEHPELLNDASGARRMLIGAPHHLQTSAVAHRLGIHGPVATISNACSSSGAALAYAFDLLQAGKADYIFAGGTDGFAKLTWAGFTALGAVASAPTGPFSATIGISLGEGAAFLVLEETESAKLRGARRLAELIGHGSSWDCYHITEPHPTGDGLLRAMTMAAHHAGVSADDIDYVNVHGTGTRANDSAETAALKRFFGRGATPPVSSSKSFTGHTLGAAAAMGCVSAIVAVLHDVMPPTANFAGPRAGCDLDYIPNTPRVGRVGVFSCQAAGFGGVNTVVIGRRPGPANVASRVPCRVGITGIGIVSAVGSNTGAFRQALRDRLSGIDVIDRFHVGDCRARRAALVRNFDLRRAVPLLNPRRVDLITQYAVASAAEALSAADVGARRVPAERMGLVVGTTRGAASSFQRSLEHVTGGNWARASAVSFPNLVMSSIGGYVSTALSLKGIASTLVGGTTCGVQTLIHAFELLRRNDTQRLVVAVIADEVSPLNFRLFDVAGYLATEHDRLGERLCPYDSAATGTVLGEGAAAFVLERLLDDEVPPVYAEIAGYGVTTDAPGPAGMSGEGRWLESAVRSALNEAAITPEDIGVIYGHGQGMPNHDFREVRALQSVFGDAPVPVGCVLGNTGLAEAASSGFSIAAAALGIRFGEAYPIVSGAPLGRELHFVRDRTIRVTRSAFVVGSADDGNNSAVILKQCDHARQWRM
jgi:3-oxoacyl-[acyl-carrier-protein] synthase II